VILEADIRLFFQSNRIVNHKRYAIDPGEIYACISTNISTRSIFPIFPLDVCNVHIISFA